MVISHVPPELVPSSPYRRALPPTSYTSRSSHCNDNYWSKPIWSLHNGASRFTLMARCDRDESKKTNLVLFRKANLDLKHRHIVISPFIPKTYLFHSSLFIRSQLNSFCPRGYTVTMNLKITVFFCPLSKMRIST
jgi:hypothetical protein